MTDGGTGCGGLFGLLGLLISIMVVLVVAAPPRSRARSRGGLTRTSVRVGR